VLKAIEPVVACTLADTTAVALPEVVIDTFPEDEVMLAPEFVKLPDPESEMFPVACMAPPGATEVPPLIVIVPSEVSAPTSEYVPDGVMVMFPPLVVVWAPLIATFPPITARFPAIEFVPEILTGRVLPALPMVRPLFPTKDQVPLMFTSALKLVAAGAAVTKPEVLKRRPAVTVPVLNLSAVIEMFEDDELPETAPMIIGFEAEAVVRSKPLAPKFRFIAPPFARNWRPSDLSTG
jgi:hypothetical protein